jgi:hypothetical protein
VTRRPSVVLVAFLVGARPATAQTGGGASLGIGIGTVRYPGGTSFSSASLSPSLQYSSSTLATALSGSFASLPGSAWSMQGRGDVWATSPPLFGSWRFSGEGIVARTSRTDSGVWTVAAHGMGEVLWSRGRWGIGIGAGPSAGWTKNVASATGLHTRVRAWWRPGAGAWRTDWSMSVEPQYLGAWFTDVTASVAFERGPVIGSLWTSARISRDLGSTAAGSAFLQFFVWPLVALEVGGGSHLSDEYQLLPRAGFVTLGVRLRGPPRRAQAQQWSPLVPEYRGDSLVVRFRYENARSVALAGQWNQWRPIPLRSLGGNLWEGTLALSRGLYHFNILVNGTEWIVPSGVTTVSDGMGGTVAVLLVP